MLYNLLPNKAKSCIALLVQKRLYNHNHGIICYMFHAWHCHIGENPVCQCQRMSWKQAICKCIWLHGSTVKNMTVILYLIFWHGTYLYNANYSLVLLSFIKLHNLLLSTLTLIACMWVPPNPFYFPSTLWYTSYKHPLHSQGIRCFKQALLYVCNDNICHLFH